MYPGWAWALGSNSGEQGFWGPDWGEVWREVKGCRPRAFFLFLEPHSWFHLQPPYLQFLPPGPLLSRPCLASFFSGLSSDVTSSEKSFLSPTPLHSCPALSVPTGLPCFHL